MALVRVVDGTGWSKPARPHQDDGHQAGTEYEDHSKLGHLRALRACGATRCGTWRSRLHDLGSDQVTASKTAQVGDTDHRHASSGEQAERLPGFKEAEADGLLRPSIPTDGESVLRRTSAMRLSKLQLNDSAIFIWEPETSEALGFGFRCGFLGLAPHGDRPGAAWSANTTSTSCTTAHRALSYKVFRPPTAKSSFVENPDAHAGPSARSTTFEEPFLQGVDFTMPSDYVGGGDQALRGASWFTEVRFANTYLSQNRVRCIIYELSTRRGRSSTCFDRLKSIDEVAMPRWTTSWRAIEAERRSCKARHAHQRRASVDALSIIVRQRQATPTTSARAVIGEAARHRCQSSMYEVAIQAAIGGLASSPARRSPRCARDVTAKCYGGDISRKKKLWAKQKEGKKRMKSIGNVDIPRRRSWRCWRRATTTRRKSVDPEQAKQRLATAARQVANEYALKLDELKANYSDFERPDFVWHYLLQSFATMGKAAGWQGLIGNHTNYSLVTYLHGRARWPCSHGSSTACVSQWQGPHARQEGELHRRVLRECPRHGRSSGRKAKAHQRARTRSEDRLSAHLSWNRPQVRAEHHDGCFTILSSDNRLLSIVESSRSPIYSVSLFPPTKATNASTSKRGAGGVSMAGELDRLMFNALDRFKVLLRQ